MRKLIPVLNVLGVVIALFSLTLVIPLGMSLYGDDAGLTAFVHATGLSFGARRRCCTCSRCAAAANWRRATASCWCRWCGACCR